MFVVNTPHQLLNAIEAVHSLRLTNNHLVVMKPKSGVLDRFMPLMRLGDWATVRVLSVWEPKHKVQKLLPPVANRLYCCVLHCLKMCTLARLAARFKDIDKLFLGHDSVVWAPFMRHIANSTKHKMLYLLDDGTDTIEINESRHRAEVNKSRSLIDRRTAQMPAGQRINARLRAKYWDWRLESAPHITFFTTYDLVVREGDQLIRNNYGYLRSLAPRHSIVMPDTIIFIGQCTNDGYIEMKAYLEFLAGIRSYFSDKKLLYVGHPRDSVSFIRQVAEQLQCELLPSPSAIEYDLVVRGIKPAAVAGFISSALITLAELMDADVKIVCFHIPPEYWIHWGGDAGGAYDYVRERLGNRITTVSVSRPENQCTAAQT